MNEINKNRMTIICEKVRTQQKNKNIDRFGSQKIKKKKFT